MVQQQNKYGDNKSIYLNPKYHSKLKHPITTIKITTIETNKLNSHVGISASLDEFGVARQLGWRHSLNRELSRITQVHRDSIDINLSIK